MGKYRAYAEYKDSGIPWAQDIPYHWAMVRNLGLFEERIQKNHPDEELLAVTIKHGVLKQTELAELTDRKNTASDDKTNYKLVIEGDIAYNKMRMWQGAIGVSSDRGIVSPAYVVLKPAHEVNSRFFYYQYKTPGFISESGRYSYGLCDDMNSLRYKDFRSLYSVTPSPEEQTQIAAFLDRETAKIDRLIAKQEALIELLKEKRQAVISHAVTKGLDPDAPMKDSGVEWLGEIPAHWGVAPFYAFFEVQLGKMLDSKKITGKHLAPYLRNTDVQWDRINTDGLPMMDFSEEDRIKFELRSGDLIVCEGGEIGRCAIWDGELQDCYYQKALHRIRPLHDSSIWIRFAFYFMRFMAKNEVFSASANQPTIAHLTAEQIRCVRIPAVPFEEQRKIANWLDTVTQKIDETVDACLEAIERLQERRTALISAAVTGKIDVREEMAETLPSVETALAVEILNRCATNCGRVKLQKLLFLSEYHGQLDIASNYYREAAGPLDVALLDRVESELEAFGYYRKCKHADGSYSYLRMENAGKEAAQSVYPSEQISKGLHIVNTLADKNTHECEAIATLYGAWNDLLIAGKEATRTAVIDEVMNQWHQNKRQTPRSEWLRWYDWVNNHMRPVGFGRSTKSGRGMMGSLLDGCQ